MSSMTPASRLTSDGTCPRPSSTSRSARQTGQTTGSGPRARATGDFAGGRRRMGRGEGTRERQTQSTSRAPGARTRTTGRPHRNEAHPSGRRLEGRRRGKEERGYRRAARAEVERKIGGREAHRGERGQLRARSLAGRASRSGTPEFRSQPSLQLTHSDRFQCKSGRRFERIVRAVVFCGRVGDEEETTGRARDLQRGEPVRPRFRCVIGSPDSTFHPRIRHLFLPLTRQSNTGDQHVNRDTHHATPDI